MPFGLRNAALTFQRFILHAVQFSYAYIDDILIFSTNQEEHNQPTLTNVSLVFHSYILYVIMFIIMASTPSRTKSLSVNVLVSLISTTVSSQIVPKYSSLWTGSALDDWSLVNWS